MVLFGGDHLLCSLSLIITMAPVLTPSLGLASSLAMAVNHSSPSTMVSFSSLKESSPLPALEPALEPAIESQEDPLNSPYPVPWAWLLKTQQNYTQQRHAGLSYYRSPALVSPDGQYAAYSRIEMRAESELHRSKALSVLFVENLSTGQLQVIRAESPIAAYLDKVGESSEEMAGVISLLIPVSWSKNGDRLLARQLEGAFNSSDISDYGVVWHRQNRRMQTLSANLQPNEEVSALLLGWDQNTPDHVLFKTSDLGEERPQFVSVGLNGHQSPAPTQTAITYGYPVNRSWTGIQAIH